MAVDHAYEKMMQAIISLATGAGELRERLSDAYSYGLAQISRDRDLSADSRRLLEEISSLGMRDGPCNAEEFKIVVAELPDRDISDLAHRVVRLFFNVSSEYWRGA